MKFIFLSFISIIQLSSAFLIKPILLYEMLLLQKCSNFAHKPDEKYILTKEIEQLCRVLPKQNKIIDSNDIDTMLENSKWRLIYNKNSLPNYKGYENILNNVSTKIFKKKDGSQIIMKYGLERYEDLDIKLIQPFSAYVINNNGEINNNTIISRIGIIYKILYLSEKIRINYVPATKSYEVFYRIFN